MPEILDDLVLTVKEEQPSFILSFRPTPPAFILTGRSTGSITVTLGTVLAGNVTLKGPKGDRGEQGLRGEQGEQGPIGTEPDMQDLVVLFENALI